MENSDVVRIGKSVDIRNRLNRYYKDDFFEKNGFEAGDLCFTYIEIEDEYERRLKEYELIREYKPCLNYCMNKK